MPETPPSPEIAILVLNYNGRRFLEECLRSVLQDRSCPAETYLIDNRSTDDSVEFTRTRFPGVKIIQHEANLGYAGAYDRVIRTLKHRYVVLLNNDTAVAPGWLGALLGPAVADPRVGACGAKIVMWHNPQVLDHGGGLLTIIGSGRDLGKWQKDAGQDEDVKDAGFASGCSLLVRRSAYLEVGGFDPDYFMYHEDVDLCWRLHLAGYAVKYVPGAVVRHHLGGGGGQGQENPAMVYRCQKNRLANMIKNLGPGSLGAGLGISAVYDGFRVLRFLALGKVDLVKVLLRGYADTLRQGRVLLKQRRRVQKARTVSEAELRPFFSQVSAAARDYLRLLRVKGGLEHR